MNIFRVLGNIFFLGKKPLVSKSWEDVRKEILEALGEGEKAKVKFATSPFYYMVTSGKETWYWVKETGKFDGTSWCVD